MSSAELEELRRERDGLAAELRNMQVNHNNLQQTMESINTMWRERVTELEERLRVQTEGREVAETRVIHLEDRCRFAEENAQAVAQHLQLKYAQKKEDVLVLRAKLGHAGPLLWKTQLRASEAPEQTAQGATTSSLVNGSRHGNGSSATCAAEAAAGSSNVGGGVEDSENAGSGKFAEMALLIDTREKQLERLAAELDVTHNRFLLEADKCREDLSTIKRMDEKLIELSQELNRQKKEVSRLQSLLAKHDQAKAHRIVLSASSVPVSVPLPDPHHLRTQPFLIPPQEFLADFRAEIQAYLNYRSRHHPPEAAPLLQHPVVAPAMSSVALLPSEPPTGSAASVHSPSSQGGRPSTAPPYPLKESFETPLQF